jgi:hypothetical protein
MMSRAWILLAVGLLVACGEEGSTINISGPAASGAVQNVAVAGPGILNVESPCAGNINAATGSTRGDGDEGSQGGGTTATGTNSPDCSRVETPPQQPTP